MSPHIVFLFSSLFSAHLAYFSVKLGLGRASLSVLAGIQCETEEALSDLQFIITQWNRRIDELRARQESNLQDTLTHFEQVAKEDAEKTISLQLQSLTMVCAVQPLCTSCF